MKLHYVLIAAISSATAIILVAITTGFAGVMSLQCSTDYCGIELQSLQDASSI